MLTDALLQLATAQTVTVAAPTTNSINLSEARDIAVGADLYLTFTVDVDPTAAGAATVTFQAISASSADLLTNPVVLSQTTAIPISDLIIHQPAGVSTANGGARKPITLSINPSSLTTLPVGQQYIGGYFLIGTGPLTAGKFSAAITDADINPGVYYPSGFTVF